MKRYATEWGKNIFGDDISNKRLIPTVFFNSQNSTAKKTKKFLIRKQAKDTKRYFTKEDLQMANKSWKDARYHQLIGKYKFNPQ